jgi:hypothetical protein
MARMRSAEDAASNSDLSFLRDAARHRNRRSP